METYLSYQEAKEAPKYILKQAQKRKNSYILRIIWDKEGGYPEHAWGYVQWSIRPYKLGYGCDGTTDANIHLIAKTFCDRMGLNYRAIYDRAYAWQRKDAGKWLENMQWEKYAKETIIPQKITKKNLQKLYNDLNDINNRSLAEELKEEWKKLGYKIE